LQSNWTLGSCIVRQLVEVSAEPDQRKCQSKPKDKQSMQAYVSPSVFWRR
jgi:hypothetical protein